MADYRPSKLSFSSASTYNQCPRRWQHHYVDQREQLTPSVPALVGSFVHQVFEFFYKEKPQKRTLACMRGLATDQFQDFVANSDDFNLWKPSDEDVIWFKQQCWPYMEGLWDMENPQEVEIIETEMDIEIDMGGFPFKGIVDRVERIDGGLVVTDYKTGSAPLKRYMGAKLAQVVLYSAVINQILNEKPSQARLMFLNDQVVATKPSTASMNRELKAMEKTWEKIHWSLETDIFPTDPGPLCGWCPHVDICQDGQEEVKSRLAAGRLKETAPAREILGLGGYSPKGLNPDR